MLGIEARAFRSESGRSAHTTVIADDVTIVAQAVLRADLPADTRKRAAGILERHCRACSTELRALMGKG